MENVFIKVTILWFCKMLAFLFYAWTQHFRFPKDTHTHFLMRLLRAFIFLFLIFVFSLQVVSSHAGAFKRNAPFSCCFPFSLGSKVGGRARRKISENMWQVSCTSNSLVRFSLKFSSYTAHVSLDLNVRSKFEQSWCLPDILAAA